MDNSKNDADSISMLKKLATSSLSSVWNQIKKMPHAILELDSAMTDLQLTTNSTATELEVFYKRSNEVAKSLGISTSAVIQATTDWTKLGYSIKEAQSLAKTSSILSSISPGMDISLSLIHIYWCHSRNTSSVSCPCPSTSLHFLSRLSP